jgi:hypothetical protein
MLRPYDPDGRPVNVPAMSEATVRTLAGAEYDFARIDASLSDLRDVLRRAAREAPACAVASRKIQAARLVLRHALDALDELVTAAVAALERLAELAPDVLAGPREEGFGEPGEPHVEEARERVQERMRQWVRRRQAKRDRES